MPRRYHPSSCTYLFSKWCLHVDNTRRWKRGHIWALWCCMGNRHIGFGSVSYSPGPSKIFSGPSRITLSSAWWKAAKGAPPPGPSKSHSGPSRIATLSGGWEAERGGVGGRTRMCWREGMVKAYGGEPGRTDRGICGLLPCGGGLLRAAWVDIH